MTGEQVRDAVKKIISKAEDKRDQASQTFYLTEAICLLCMILGDRGDREEDA